MEPTTETNNGADLILEYAYEKTSWRALIFSKFTRQQKILFFLPIPFLYLSIYGVYDLFYNNSWVLFLTFGFIMLLSMWAFFRIKSVLEKKVIETYYAASGCKNLAEYHLHNISELLGEQNTPENRALWKTQFKPKAGLTLFFTIGLMFVFMFSQNLFKQQPEHYLSVFYIGWFSFFIVVMTFAFVKPAFIDFKSKKAAHNEAFKLIYELDKRAGK